MDSKKYNISRLFKPNRVFFIIFFLNMVFVGGSAQKVRNTMNNRFTEHYEVMASDTNKLDGDYALYYKTTLVESGIYFKGERKGIWTFYNLGGDFEFEYDFDRDSLLRFTRSEYYKLRNDHPTLFLGSPLIPYVYISSMVGYPDEAFVKGIQGKVVLTLRISDEGKILDRYISQSLNGIMDSAVLKAAWSFPDTWEWLPAKRMGENVESYYNITVFFDID